MGILSRTATITRYQAPEKGSGPDVVNRIANALNKRFIRPVQEAVIESNIGWANITEPDAEICAGEVATLLGDWFAFVLRMDKKAVSGKVLKQQLNNACKRRIEETGREFLSREEKKQIREDVKRSLLTRTPMTPRPVSVVWNLETGHVWIYTSNRSVLDEFENLFFQTFGFPIVQLFPYSLGFFADPDRFGEALDRLAPARIGGSL